MLRRSMFLAIVVILFCTFSATALEFNPVTIDEGTDQGYMPSMVMDVEGNPHIVSLGEGSKTLNYSHFDGTDWEVQTVDVCDRAKFFGYPSIALDEYGRVHISYYIGVNRNDLLYAFFDGNDWVKETVDTQGDAGMYSSIAIDSEGDPCIGYGVEDTFEIRLASRKDGAWSVGMVTSDDSSLVYPSMVLDSLDRPHFIYLTQSDDSYSCHLNYLVYEGEESVPQQVDQEGCRYNVPSLALDQNDQPHILYHAATLDKLEYTFISGDEWEYLPLATANYSRNESTRSIAVDPVGKVHVCYSIRDLNIFPKAEYAVLEDGSWTSADIGSQGDLYATVALSPDGEPAVCYMDRMNSDLRFSYLEGDEWTKTTVPPSGIPTGYVPLMRLDREDKPHVIYCDSYSQHITYAVYDGKSWKIKRNDPVESFFDFPALGFNQEGVPYAAFTEINEESHGVPLKLGVLSGDEWTLEEIAPFGIFPSLAIGKDGSPGVCFTGYEDLSSMELGESIIHSMQLCYARKNEGSWNIEQVTSYDISVASRHIRCLDLINDQGDIPSICYLERLLANDFQYLKYAVSTDQGWQMETISSDISVNAAVMGFDNNQVLHMAFAAIPEEIDIGIAEETSEISPEEVPVYALYYASRNEGNWTIERVEDLGENLYLRQLSLLFDEGNNPHITYSSGTTYLQYAGDEIVEKQYAGLKYAYNDGENWHTAVLAKGLMGSYGSYSSLALDSSETPHVAYFTGKGLNYGKVRAFSSGGGCSLGSISPLISLLLLPLLFMKKK